MTSSACKPENVWKPPVPDNVSHSDTDLADLQQQCEQLQTQLKDAEKSKRDLEKRNKEEVNQCSGGLVWSEADHLDACGAGIPFRS